MKAKYLFETIFTTENDCGNPKKEKTAGSLKKKDCRNPPNDEEVLLELRGLPK
jgi:hypothetical protein